MGNIAVCSAKKALYTAFLIIRGLLVITTKKE